MRTEMVPAHRRSRQTLVFQRIFFWSKRQGVNQGGGALSILISSNFSREKDFKNPDLTPRHPHPVLFKSKGSTVAHFQVKKKICDRFLASQVECFHARRKVHVKINLNVSELMIFL